MTDVEPAGTPAKKRGFLRWIGLAVVVAIGIGVLAAALGGDDEEPAASSEPAGARTATTSSTTTTTTLPYAPVPGDFALSVTTLEKQCFGSAGCIVTFRVGVSYVGTVLPDASESYEVVYEVLGGEEPKINRFTITGTQVSSPAEEILQTATSEAELSAVPTTVLAS